MSAREISKLTVAGVDHWKGVPLNPARLERAKSAYTTRNVDFSAAVQLLTGAISPVAGDLVLARVERLGQHKRIEMASGRRADMRVGDEIVVAYGARYAPDQFESYVPGDLGPCDLVAAGGVASDCKVKHSRMKNPTRIQPIGLLADEFGARLNLSRWSLEAMPAPAEFPTVIAVLGTMMNAGKTTCAADMVHGYKQMGLKVGAAKVTGTGAGGDRWSIADAGADRVLDFTDMGEPTTFGLAPERVETIFTTLVNHLAGDGCDVIIIEVADGLFQRETAELLRSDVFRGRTDGLMFAAGDALGSLAGVEHLERQGFTVYGAGGAMTASPLATREARNVLDVPVVTSAELSSGRWLPPVRDLEEAPEARKDEDPMSEELAALVGPHPSSPFIVYASGA